MTFCSSLTDAIGRHLSIEFCGRDELAHVADEGSRDATVRQQVREMID
jgi:hypothetical protein